MAGSTSGRGGLFGRLYRGEVSFDFVGSRKKWYIASAIIILICLLSIIFRSFNFGVEFKGGSQYSVGAKAGLSISDVRGAVSATGIDIDSVVKAGTGGTATYQVTTERLQPEQNTKVIDALKKVTGGSTVNVEQVSSTWGHEVSKSAIEALIVFLIIVSGYISIRFRDWRMALAAVLALFHDLILTAGVYSIIGFEVTPGTIVGLLTILGYSLYDTVVVFDKVDENTRGILSATRYTYGEAANSALNQTLMRSINTSVIGLLPVAGLLFVGAGLLGVGTLEDLALVLFVGMLTGAYSSLFLATPWLVDLKMFDPKYKNHAARVMARRRPAEPGTGKRGAVRPAAPADRADDDADDDEDLYASTATSAPRVGAKPQQARPAAAKRSGSAGGGNRPRPGSSRSGGSKRR